MVSDKFEFLMHKVRMIIYKYVLFSFWLTLSVYSTSDGQKLGQHRRSKRLQAKRIGIQDLDGGDTDNDIFKDCHSTSEDGKSGQSSCLSS